MAGSAVVFGASGGIGRALVSAIAGAGRFAAVHAVSRNPADFPDNVALHRADVTDEVAIRQVAARIGAAGPVSLTIVASGLLHDAEVAPEKSMKALDPRSLSRLFAVNAIGPALVAKHFIPLTEKQGRSVFAALSARVGSIGDNRLGGWYGYRASKAALNQLLRTLAIEVARGRPEAVVIGLHPGTVATGLSQPFRGDAAPDIMTPGESARHLLRVIEAATPHETGQVLAWDGSRIPF